MSEKFKAPRGTFDVVPEQQPVRRRIGDVARRRLEAAGYGRMDTPIFEETDLFARGVGESTDIVQKQMFTFEDQGGRSLTLRPEATASVCRAYLEHGMRTRPQPVKLWTEGPFFRHERPQAGRYRQFTQVNAEAIGSDSPLVDAELILLAGDILAELGVEDVRLRLGSLGTPAARAAYLDELREYLRSRQDELSDEVRGRIDANPLRAFDADHEGTRKVDGRTPRPCWTASIPPTRSTSPRSAPCSIGNGVSYDIDPDPGARARLLHAHAVRVRVRAPRRPVRDRRRRSLRRPDRAARGPADAGLRLGARAWTASRLALEQQEGAAATRARSRRDGVFVVAEDDDRERALTLATELRRAGIPADLDLAGRAIKGQMKQADRVGARHALILAGDAKATLRDMSSGEEREIDPATLVETLSSP